MGRLHRRNGAVGQWGSGAVGQRGIACGRLDNRGIPCTAVAREQRRRPRRQHVSPQLWQRQVRGRGAKCRGALDTAFQKAEIHKWWPILKEAGVCTENSVLIDYVTESPNVSGDDRSGMLLPDPVSLAVQVEEPT
jgi:hypothetical protein